jgi:hypothetical protein
MFAIVKEDRVKQRLYLSNGAFPAWRLKTRAEWLRVTSCGADQIPQGTQSQVSPHLRLSEWSARRIARMAPAQKRSARARSAR